MRNIIGRYSHSSRSSGPLRLLAATALLLATVGCLDLDIANPNSPDRSSALASARDVESLIGSTFLAWWDLKHRAEATDRRGAGNGLGGLADVRTSLGSEMLDYHAQPRHELPNQIGFQWGYPIRDPWLLGARTLGALRDGLKVIDEGLQIGDGGRDNPRALAFGAFVQGVMLGHFAKLYDQSFVEDPTKDAETQVSDLDLRPYPEVLQSSLAALERARTIASQNSFTTPPEWMGGAYTSQNMVSLSHSFAARFMASVARTPAERAAVNWQAVLSHIDQGITQDFGIQIEPGSPWGRGHNSPIDVSVAFVGRADQSGGWQAWERATPNDRLPFFVETDDQRIHALGNPEASGSLFEIPGFILGDLTRGTWSGSYYRTWKFRDLSDTGFGFVPEITVREMELLRAEGLIRLGRPDEALPLINSSRVAAGLPAATVNGVSGPRCVPRTPTGECGSLLYALLYEKSMETLVQTAGLDFWDARGFGTLRVGSALQLPLPADELENLLIPVYSFGGGGAGSSPGWTLQ